MNSFEQRKHVKPCLHKGCQEWEWCHKNSSVLLVIPNYISFFMPRILSTMCKILSEFVWYENLITFWRVLLMLHSSTWHLKLGEWKAALCFVLCCADNFRLFHPWYRWSHLTYRTEEGIAGRLFRCSTKRFWIFWDLACSADREKQGCHNGQFVVTGVKVTNDFECPSRIHLNRY